MIFIITLILSIHGVETGITTQALFKTFTDRQDCEVAEGEILTQAYNDPDVVGWLMPDECREVGNVPKKA